MKPTATTEGGREPEPTRPATKPLEITEIIIEPYAFNDVNWSLKIKNPDETYAVEQAIYRIEMLDADGQNAGELNLVVFIGPNEVQTQTGRIAVPDPSRVSTTKVSMLFPGKAVAVSAGEHRLTAAKAILQQGQGSPIVTGEFSSTYADDILAPVFTAAAFDNNGNLIGYGKKYGSPIPAGATVPVAVPIELDQEPAAVGLYFTPDMGTSLRPASGLELVTEQVDFIPRADGFGYPGGVVAVLRNPDSSRMAVDIYYSLAVYDKSGNVISACQDILSGVIFPGDRLGFGCPLDLPPDSAPVRAEVFALPGDAPTPYNEILLNPLTVDDITLESYTVRATVHNTLPRDLEYTYALAVGYDAEGRLAGHSFYSLDTMSANESRVIDIGMYQGSSPIVRVEVFPIISMSTIR